MAEERAHRRRWVRRAAYVIVGASAIAAVIVALRPRPVPIDVAQVSRGPFVVTIDEDGRTRVKDRHVVSAPLSGSLDRPTLHAGDAVESGQVVARLTPIASPLLDERTRLTMEGRVAQAEAGLGQARAAIERVRTAKVYSDRELERQRSLRAEGAVAVQMLERAELDAKSRSEEMASAEFGARVAEHEVSVARAALGLLRGSTRRAAPEEFVITAPVAGVVLRVFQESGGVVLPGTPILELGDPRALEIVVDVLTADAVAIAPGARATIERWGGEKPLAAHVRMVEPSAFTRVSALGVEEQRVNVVLDLDAPYETRALGDGYRAECASSSTRPPASRARAERSLQGGRKDGPCTASKSRSCASFRRDRKTSDRALEVRSGVGENDRVVLT